MIFFQTQAGLPGCDQPARLTLLSDLQRYCLRRISFDRVGHLKKTRDSRKFADLFAQFFCSTAIGESDSTDFRKWVGVGASLRQAREIVGIEKQNGARRAQACDSSSSFCFVRSDSNCSINLECDSNRKRPAFGLPSIALGTSWPPHRRQTGILMVDF